MTTARLRRSRSWRVIVPSLALAIAIHSESSFTSSPLREGVPLEILRLRETQPVGQNATLFPKSQISANYFFAQVYYLQQIKKLVAKVAKVSKVTFAGRKLVSVIIQLIYQRYSTAGEIAAAPDLPGGPPQSRGGRPRLPLPCCDRPSRPGCRGTEPTVPGHPAKSRMVAQSRPFEGMWECYKQAAFTYAPRSAVIAMVDRRGRSRA